MLVDGAAIAITKRGGRHRCAYIQKRIGDNQMSKITRGETNKKVEKYVSSPMEGAKCLMAK
jgi:hypothetical protein